MSSKTYENVYFKKFIDDVYKPQNTAIRKKKIYNNIFKKTGFNSVKITLIFNLFCKNSITYKVYLLDIMKHKLKQMKLEKNWYY